MVPSIYVRCLTTASNSRGSNTPGLCRHLYTCASTRAAFRLARAYKARNTPFLTHPFRFLDSQHSHAAEIQSEAGLRSVPQFSGSLDRHDTDKGFQSLVQKHVFMGVCAQLYKEKGNSPKLSTVDSHTVDLGWQLKWMCVY